VFECLTMGNSECQLFKVGCLQWDNLNVDCPRVGQSKYLKLRLGQLLVLTGKFGPCDSSDSMTNTLSNHGYIPKKKLGNMAKSGGLCLC
jgi:hypothetical protein